MALDPKVRNLIIFLVKNVGGVIALLAVGIKLSGVTNIFTIVGFIGSCVGLWRICLHTYRRLILPPKDPLAYGKWAIVTGSTSGIGKEFADYLAKKGMSLLIISRSEDKLKEQQKELLDISNGKHEVRYLAYDFTRMDGAKDEFYAKLDKECAGMNNDGGLGLLINNVGTANEIPMKLEEFSDKEVEDMINCNIFSTIWMTRTVTKYMRERKNGAVVSISSGSGNHCGPFLAVYSATKAFITQFSRSLHVENWGSGVDFLVVTPFYVVSNLYKRKTGTLIAPMPIELVRGTFKQLGKQMVWQGHGYWFHGFIGNFSSYYWDTVHRYRKMMLGNRERYDERQSAKTKKN